MVTGLGEAAGADQSGRVLHASQTFDLPPAACTASHIDGGLEARQSSVRLHEQVDRREHVRAPRDHDLATDLVEA